MIKLFFPMTAIEQLLSDTAHRTFDYPKSRWIYYQEWNNALFLHWKVPVTLLEKLVPEKLNIDTFDGHAYVSLVAFTMQKIRPRNLPAIAFISDFDEINIRTYIDNDNKKGVYFLNIEAAKSISAYIAKKLSGLPYEKSVMKRSDTSYSSYNKQKTFALETEFEIKEPISSKTALDKWLTERYCLYLDQEKSLYCYDIHHKEWEIKNVHLKQLSLNYTIGNVFLSNTPDFIHYSDGVKVVAWERSKI